MSKKYNRPANRSKGGARLAAAIIAGLLAFLMVASTVLGALSAAAADSEKVSGLKQQLEEAGQRKTAAQSRINELRQQKSSILAEIEQIDAEVEAAEDEIALQEELIAQLGAQIVVKTEELRESQAKEDAQYDKLRDRVRVMYENGTGNYLAILLSSDSFNDFLSRYEVVSQISKYDNTLLEELREIKQQVEDQKTSLESDKADAEALMVSMEENKKALEQRLSDRTAQMLSIQQAEGDEIALYEEIVKEQDEINAQIIRTLAEEEAARKKAAEEEARRRAEEAKRAAAGSSSSSSGSSGSSGSSSSGTIYVGGSFMWPLPPSNNVVTCRFGMRLHPVTKVYKLHTGADLRASSGTNIYASNGGTVTTSAYSTAYGNYVVINHGGGIATLYAHMRKRAVSAGDTVSKGQVIGYVGMTGYATGPHLHFEIIRNGVQTNPLTEFSGYVFK